MIRNLACLVALFVGFIAAVMGLGALIPTVLSADWSGLPNLLTHGLGMRDLALAVLRGVAGAFFAISGYHKLFNKSRHERLVQTLRRDKVPAVGFNQWWVPAWEFVGGLMLAVGFLTAFSAVVLAIICVVACVAEAREKVASYQPIDAADVLDDYLYLPEVLYLVMLAATMLAGTGHYSVDALLFPL